MSASLLGHKYGVCCFVITGVQKGILTCQSLINGHFVEGVLLNTSGRSMGSIRNVPPLSPFSFTFIQSSTKKYLPNYRFPSHYGVGVFVLKILDPPLKNIMLELHFKDWHPLLHESMYRSATASCRRTKSGHLWILSLASLVTAWGHICHHHQTLYGLIVGQRLYHRLQSVQEAGHAEELVEFVESRVMWRTGHFPPCGKSWTSPVLEGYTNN